MEGFDFSKVYLFRKDLSGERVRSLYDRLRLVKSESRKFNGLIYTFGIIGASHFIHPIDLTSSEILSCVKIEDFGEPLFEHDIRYDTKFWVEGDNVRTLIEVERFKKQWLEEFLKIANISHKFADDAYTAIKINNNDSWETIHTYPEPELNALVYSRTEFR